MSLKFKDWRDIKSDAIFPNPPPSRLDYFLYFFTHRLVLAGHWTPPQCSPCRCCRRWPRPPWWWPGGRLLPPSGQWMVRPGARRRLTWRPGGCRGEGMRSCSLYPMMTCYLSVEKGWRGKERRPQPRIPEIIGFSFSFNDISVSLLIKAFNKTNIKCNWWPRLFEIHDSAVAVNELWQPRIATQCKCRRGGGIEGR